MIVLSGANSSSWVMTFRFNCKFSGTHYLNAVSKKTRQNNCQHTSTTSHAFLNRVSSDEGCEISIFPHSFASFVSARNFSTYCRPSCSCCSCRSTKQTVPPLLDHFAFVSIEEDFHVASIGITDHVRQSSPLSAGSNDDHRSSGFLNSHV